MTGENDPGFGKTVAAQTPGKRAEEKVATDTKSFPDMSVSEMPGLIHELRVHQVELEMQNGELRKNQAETERSCKAYQDLWELSPVGCLIVDIDGRVTAVNRAGQRLSYLSAGGQLTRKRARSRADPGSAYGYYQAQTSRTNTEGE